MSDRSAIEWTDATWNPMTGCSRVSPGCDNCYMFRQYPRLRAMGVRGYEKSPDHVQILPERFAAPLRWRKPRRVFVNSMSDTFHPHVGFEAITYLFTVMKFWAPLHTYQVLTKRPGRAVAWWEQVGRHQLHDWPANIWIGTSVENQKYAPRLTVLDRIPAPVRFVSAEPLIAPVDLRPWLDRLQWVIVGGESGPGARDMSPVWAERIRDDCARAGVAFFMKQMARRGEIPPQLLVREYPA